MMVIMKLWVHMIILLPLCYIWNLEVSPSTLLSFSVPNWMSLRIAAPIRFRFSPACWSHGEWYYLLYRTLHIVLSLMTFHVASSDIIIGLSCTRVSYTDHYCRCMRSDMADTLIGIDEFIKDSKKFRMRLPRLWNRNSHRQAGKVDLLWDTAVYFTYPFPKNFKNLSISTPPEDFNLKPLIDIFENTTI